MARSMMMAMGVVSILIANIILLVSFTELEGDDKGGGGGNTLWANILVLLYLLPLASNNGTFIVLM